MELECLRILKIGHKLNITKKINKNQHFFQNIWIQRTQSKIFCDGFISFFHGDFWPKMLIFVRIFQWRKFSRQNRIFGRKWDVKHFKTWSKQRYCIINEKRRHKYEQVFDSYLPVPSPPPETSVLQMAMNKGRLPISSLQSYLIVWLSGNQRPHQSSVDMDAYTILARWSSLWLNHWFFVLAEIWLSLNWILILVNRG